MPLTFHRVADPELLRLLDLPLHNGRAPDLQAYLAPKGYDLAAFDAAQLQRDAYAETLRRLQDAKGERKTASQAKAGARAAFHADPYMDHVETARVALRAMHGALVSLGLHEPRARTYPAWLGQALQFYENAHRHPEVLDALALRGLTVAVLNDGRTALDAVDDLARAHVWAQGEVKTLAAQRRTERAALIAWLSDFRALARIALRAKPEWLERLGIRHRSG